MGGKCCLPWPVWPVGPQGILSFLCLDTSIGTLKTSWCALALGLGSEENHWLDWLPLNSSSQGTMDSTASLLGRIRWLAC